MADKQLTIEQINIALDKALKPVYSRLDRIEERAGGVEEGVIDLKRQMRGLDKRMENQEELLREVKIDLDVIKDDYIGQIEEIRSHVGMSPLIKHKSV